MTTNTPVPAALTALIEPLVAESGLDIYDLERVGPIVRVIVDLPDDRRDQVVVPAQKPGAADDASEAPLPPSVGIGDLARLTRAISRAIDEHDPIPGQFTLEVTSPGLERNLRTPEHFIRAIGERISVKMVHTFDGPRRVAGVLTAADQDGITLTVDPGAAGSAPSESGPTPIAHRDIDKARTLYEFPAQAKPGSKKGPGAKPKAGSAGTKRSDKKSSPKKAKAS